MGVSSLCDVGLLSLFGASSAILNTVDNKVFWVEESLKYQIGGWCMVFFTLVCVCEELGTFAFLVGQF